MIRRSFLVAVLLLVLPGNAYALCGDGVLDAGEECDDHNAINGDGCSASCLLPWTVVVAGQSNAEGRSTIYQDTPTARVTSPDPANGLISRMFRSRYLFDTQVPFPTWVMANHWPCAESQCTPKPGGTCDGRTAATHVALDPLCTCHCGVTDVDADDETDSAWPTFAQRIMGDVGREVDAVVVARGSTALVAADGDPPAEPLWDSTVDCTGRTWTNRDAWTDERGDLYCLLLHAVAEAGVGSRLSAVLWYQGEDDARWFDRHGTPTGAEYKAALEQLADDLWDQLHVPMIVAPISLRTFPGDPAGPADPGDGTTRIHDAALEAIAEHPHIYRGPSTDDLEHEDSVHIRDVVTLGQRWAIALRSMLAGRDYDGIATTFSQTQCDDGIDNDGDGRVDAADPGCASAADVDEHSPLLPCDDGVDNDGDGRADFPSDPGCTDPSDESEHAAALPCDDGIDNDGDGLVDYRVDGSGDPGCFDATSASSENPACQNGLDDDGDGKIDSDGGAAANHGVALGAPDPQCTRAYVKSEKPARSCGLGVEALVAVPLLARLRRRRATR